MEYGYVYSFVGAPQQKQQQHIFVHSYTRTQPRSRYFFFSSDFGISQESEKGKKTPRKISNSAAVAAATAAAAAAATAAAAAAHVCSCFWHLLLLLLVAAAAAAVQHLRIQQYVYFT